LRKKKDIKFLVKFLVYLPDQSQSFVGKAFTILGEVEMVRRSRVIKMTRKFIKVTNVCGVFRLGHLVGSNEKFLVSSPLLPPLTRKFLLVVLLDGENILGSL
jgi:hypothetical protein